MIIPENYGQVNLRFIGPSAPSGAEVTLGLNVEVYPSSPAVAADAIYNNWNTTVRLVQTSTVELTEVLVKFGPNSVGPSGVRGGSTVGALAAITESPSVSVLVQKVTGFGGRAGRGRFYWPGARESMFDSSGLADPVLLAAWQTQMDNFYTEMVSDGLIPTLLHGESSPISVPLPITSFEVDGRAATQRRRLRR
jgi:hypothetical protein